MRGIKYVICLFVSILFPMVVSCQNPVKKTSTKDKESKDVIILDEKTPEVEWYKTYGGSYNDEGNCVRQTLDGGFIITGGTQYGVKQPADVILIKTDAEGNKIWEKKFGKSKKDDWSNCVLQTTDVGYIITGYTTSYGASGDGWLIKTDAKGDKQWGKTFGGEEFEWAYSIQHTIDSGYIITGYTQMSGYDKPNSTGGDVWLVKTDEQGIKLWEKFFGGKEEEWGFSVLQTIDGGYVITGFTESYGEGKQDIWLIKTDSHGNKLWDKTFGGNENDCGYNIQHTSDGGYIICGFTESFGEGDSDVWLIKTDANGNKLWDKTFGGKEQDGGGFIQRTKDGGYIILGATYSKGEGSRDIWLIKTDNSGYKIWDKTLGGSEKDEGNWIQLTSDGGYIITGWTESYGAGMEDILLVKLK